MRRYLALILPAVCMIALTGCSGADRPSWLSIDPNNWSNRRIVDEPMLLTVAGPLQIDVETFNGEVFIEGRKDLDQVELTVVREATHGHTRTDEARASLHQITWTADVVPAELGQQLQVRTATTHAEPYFQRAHVYIKAPDVENIRIRTTNGRVWVKDIRGKVDISTTEDDVRVMTSQPLRRAVTIVNRNGDIDLRVRAESQGMIDAQTVNGKAAVFAKYGRIILDPATRPDKVQASFNGGTNPITLRTVNGNITVTVASNPEEVDDNRLR